MTCSRRSRRSMPGPGGGVMRKISPSSSMMTGSPLASWHRAAHRLGTEMVRVDVPTRWIFRVSEGDISYFLLTTYLLTSTILNQCLGEGGRPFQGAVPLPLPPDPRLDGGYVLVGEVLEAALERQVVPHGEETRLLRDAEDTILALHQREEAGLPRQAGQVHGRVRLGPPPDGAGGQE